MLGPELSGEHVQKAFNAYQTAMVPIQERAPGGLWGAGHRLNGCPSSNIHYTQTLRRPNMSKTRSLQKCCDVDLFLFAFRSPSR
jgi:hypothetical protein